MANSTLSPNMNLPVPTVSTDPGPDWSNNLNASLSIIDQHNHSAGSGVPINSSGININDDLAFNGHNATILKSSRYQVQSVPLSGASDIGCVYVSGVDLYYNDINGNQVKITSGGSVNATSSGISSGTATASFVGGVLVVNAASLTPANIQGASILIGNNVASSKFVTLSPVNSLASNYNLVLPQIPVAQSIMALDTSGNITAPYTVDNSTIVITANVIQVPTGGITATQIASQTITQSKMALRATGSTVGIGGFAISSSSGSFSTGSASETPVTNLSVTITTNGNPVQLALIPDGTVSIATIQSNGFGGSGVSNISEVQFLNGASNVGIMQFGPTTAANTNPSLSLPPGAFSATDFPVAGTYTYSVSVGVVSASSIQVNNVKLTAYEMK